MPSYDEGDYPDTAFHSHFAATFGVSDDVAEWTPAHRARAKRHFAVFKQVRQYLAGDFYPLTPLPSSLDAWDGWQFHDPAAGEGFVAAFRLRSGEAQRRLRLRGLDPACTYAVVDPYTGETVATQPGAELAGQGLPLALHRNGLVIRTYRLAQSTGASCSLIPWGAGRSRCHPERSEGSRGLCPPQSTGFLTSFGMTMAGRSRVATDWPDGPTTR